MEWRDNINAHFAIEDFPGVMAGKNISQKSIRQKSREISLVPYNKTTIVIRSNALYLYYCHMGSVYFHSATPQLSGQPQWLINRTGGHFIFCTPNSTYFRNSVYKVNSWNTVASTYLNWLRFPNSKRINSMKIVWGYTTL